MPLAALFCCPLPESRFVWIHFWFEPQPQDLTSFWQDLLNRQQRQCVASWLPILTSMDVNLEWTLEMGNTGLRNQCAILLVGEDCHQAFREQMSRVLGKTFLQ